MSTTHPYHIHNPSPPNPEHDETPPNAVADGLWRKPEEDTCPSVDGIGFVENPALFPTLSNRSFQIRFISWFLQTFRLNVKPTDSLWVRYIKNIVALGILSLPVLLVIFSVVEVIVLAALRGPSFGIQRHLPHSIRVAFVGNSITFVNDLPRLMEALSWNTIEQNSCLHGSLSFVSILTKGNGMNNKWRTSTALLSDNSSSTTPMYDFGACTVRQLLLGYDKYLTESNANGHYMDDGMNPCFQDANYYDYVTELYSMSAESSTAFLQWDYVVMNDQTVQPGLQRRRKRSLRSLRRVYAKLFNQTTTTTPVLLSTYGYDKSLYDDDDADDLDESDDDENDEDDDSYEDEEDEQQQKANDNKNKNYNHNDDAIYSALGDVPEFTSRIWYGYQLYAQSLGKVLPASQQPLVVPSALAFLLIWEENYSAWLMLFYEDGFHPSPHGTYLLGCCLYATLYRRMPPPPTYSWQESGSFSWSRRHTKYKGNDTAPMQALFSQARRMHTESMGDDRPYPTVEEAMYLYSIAERVVLKKAVPISLLSAETIAQMEAQEAASG